MPTQEWLDYWAENTTVTTEAEDPDFYGADLWRATPQDGCWCGSCIDHDPDC